MDKINIMIGKNIINNTSIQETNENEVIKMKKDKSFIERILDFFRKQKD